MRCLRSQYIVIPLLALLATMPLIIHGCSCGHDQPFHVQSWLDAAQQFRHGTLYPRWAFSPAWQAGEPRFTFYPPLSWFLGALLTMLFPMNAVPVIFTWIALTGAGFSMHHVARRFSSARVALLCASVYLANPYMLFNAFERGAYAELLAATWIPLVLLSVMEDKPSVHRIAIPLGLTWLTNAPAGVMATYAVALLAAVRFLADWKQAQSNDGPARLQRSLRLAATISGGVLLSLLLVSFYLLPAAYERRYVQVAMAIIPNLRYQDNFLFGKTDYVPHNEITFSVSVLALTMLLLTLAASAFAYVRGRKESHESPSNGRVSRSVALQLIVLVMAIGVLLTPSSSFVWEYLPNMKYLQFPWRLLSILSVVLAFGFAPVFAKLGERRALALIASAAIVLGLSQLGSHLYRQACETHEYPAFEASAFRTGHGVLPTDEYTPTDADNDVQRTDNPGYWLIHGDVNQPAPGTIANPNESIVNFDGPIPFENTVAARAPLHLMLTLNTPTVVVLNLRDYPSWHLTRNGSDVPTHLHRDDGLLAVALPAGRSSLDNEWIRPWDQIAGVALSICGVIVLGVVASRSRKIEA